MQEINKSVMGRHLRGPDPGARHTGGKAEHSLTEILPLEQAFDAALGLLEAGEAVAIPTETVYGLAADATNGEAVARIFETKGRPRFNPLIVHVCDLAMAQRIAVFDPASLRLAEAFWPGPLTLVLPLRQGHDIHPLVTAGLETVAVRMPRGIARDLVARLGRPVAAPSANASGKISPTTARAVAESLGEGVALVVDGGSAPVGVESTIVKATPQAIHLLRPGGVATQEIESLLGIEARRGGQGGIEAPGMLASHYAPDATVRLDATEVRAGEALLAFGPRRIAGAGRALAVLNLSPEGNMREAAASLYAHLQALDRSGAAVIAVEPVPGEGLGEAINDRLRRAAAPRAGGAAG